MIDRAGRRRLVLFSPGVWTGGGLAQLQAMLDEAAAAIGWAILDARAADLLAIPDGIPIRWVQPRTVDRLTAELEVSRRLSADDVLVCSHSMAPLFRSQAHVCVIVQNRLLIEPGSWRALFSPQAWPLAVRRVLLRAVRGHADEYVVQTPSMLSTLRAWHPGGPPSRVMPFLDRSLLASAGERPWTVQREFLYVADGLPHKNHRRLLEAWISLAAQGIRPRLSLTLGPRDAALMATFERARDQHGLLIENLGSRPREEMLELYATAKALIYPSTAESYGLPLIEATRCGLPVVASELDFVRDVCTPVETFDPRSSVSIARAVRRFLGRPEPAARFYTVHEFAQYLLAQEPAQPLRTAA